MRITLLVAVGLVGCGDGRERAPTSPLVAIAKACHGDAEMACPRPIFNVRDLRAAQRYYRDALGFKVDWDYGDPPDFGSVSRGDAMLFMCQGCQGVPGAWVMVFTHDVDALHDEYVRRKAIIRM